MSELYRPRRKVASTPLSVRDLDLAEQSIDPQLSPQATAGEARLDDGATIQVKAVTLYPIWAWAVMHGPKRVENRSWATRYRGRLAIHAGIGRQKDAEARAMLERLVVPVPAELTRGAILGTVQLLDCRRCEGELRDDPFACGPYCWLLGDPRPFVQPIPARGQQSLWTCQLPESVLP